MARLRIYVDTSVIGGCFDAEFVTWPDALMRDILSLSSPPRSPDSTMMREVIQREESMPSLAADEPRST